MMQNKTERTLCDECDNYTSMHGAWIKGEKMKVYSEGCDEYERSFGKGFKKRKKRCQYWIPFEEPPEEDSRYGP